MAFYARPSWRLARQVSGDVAVVAWGIVCWVLSRLVDGVIRGLADPVRALAGSAAGLRENLNEAAVAAGKVPVVGRELRQPLDGATGGVADLTAQLQAQAHQIDVTATVTGWVVFALPLAMVLAYWLPVRWRQHRVSAAARQLASGPGSAELLALRAIATLPMRDLARISADPVAAWRAGDIDVIERLAAAELRRAGVAAPPGRAETARPGSPPDMKPQT